MISFGLNAVSGQNLLQRLVLALRGIEAPKHQQLDQQLELLLTKLLQATGGSLKLFQSSAWYGVSVLKASLGT